jgi:hypothetical protein
MEYVVSCKSRISGCYSTCKDTDGECKLYIATIEEMR